MFGLLAMLGFSSVGPKAGTIAAYLMSTYAASGGVPAGSFYATVQSVAMGGSLLQPWIIAVMLLLIATGLLALFAAAVFAA